MSVVHACPVKGATCPCCGKTPFELPFFDQITSDWQLVTCASPYPLQPKAQTKFNGQTPTLVVVDEA
jgi:hypothetical protein